MRKIYVVGNAKNYAAPFKNFEVTDNFDESDLVLFTGGEDVDPSFYGQTADKSTHFNTDRDLREKGVFYKCCVAGKPMLGICRGAQFLTVMSGGDLIQDVTGHAIATTHEIILLDPEKVGFQEDSFNMSSTHHQMMYPFDLDDKEYEIIATSKNYLSKYYKKNATEFFNPDEEEVEECEIVYYNGTNCLCIQGHPEMIPEETKTIEMVNNCIEAYLFNENIEFEEDEFEEDEFEEDDDEKEEDRFFYETVKEIENQNDVL
jgi:gamma-glutamyl-gamma-aminobutyrate hydrolase PuuD